MMITNAIGFGFDIVGSARMFICLGLSFVVGTLVFAGQAKGLWQKLVLYVLNSLIIFSMAAGTNSATQAAAAAREKHNVSSENHTYAPLTDVVTNTATNITVLSNRPPFTTNVIRIPIVKMRPTPRFLQSWH